MPIYKIEKRKDGLQGYRVRLNKKDSAGNYIQIERTAYGLAEARELERQLLFETKRKRRTVGQVFEEYKDYKKSSLRLSSLLKTVGILKTHVLPFCADLDIKKLTKQKIVEWKKKISEKDLAITTKRNAYREFSALLNFAVKMEYIDQNPLTILGNFRDKNLESNKKIQFYTPEEFRKYIRAARAYADEAGTLNAYGYFVFFAIAFYTGARKGEINALKWTDINGDILSISRSVNQKIKGVSEFEGAVKNKSSIREIQIPTPLMKILSEHKERQKKVKGFSEDLRICGGIECLKDTSIENANIIFAKRAELPKIRIHDFRHSHASLLCNEGINIQEIARRLGHSNVQTTWNTYSHLYPREQERAVSVLNSVEV